MKTLPFLFALLFWGSLTAQTQSELFLRAGVIGDSLSEAFFGVTVENAKTLQLLSGKNNGPGKIGIPILIDGYKSLTVKNLISHSFGLRDAGTQMQIMEKVKPTFLFGTASANHVLCTALHTSLDCLDEARFKRDIREVMRRMAAIGSIKGGVLFTIPNVITIAYLEPYRDPQRRANYTGLKAFYRSSVSDPSQVLDATEVATIGNFLNMLNNEIKAQAAAMGFAVTDVKVLFDDIRENERLFVVQVLEVQVLLEPISLLLENQVFLA